jgi:hypothetical protein
MVKSVQRVVVVGALSLALSACAAWGQLGQDASRIGWVSAENTITPANVDQLQLAWSIPSTQYAGAYLANGFVYSIDTLANPARLVAFSADGTQGCGGTPRTCSPRWSAPLAGVLNGTEASGAEVIGSPFLSSSVAVVGSDAFVVSRTTNTVHLQAFDASGVTDCGGTPKICTPRWHAQRKRNPGHPRRRRRSGDHADRDRAHGRALRLRAGRIDLWRERPGLRAGVDECDTEVRLPRGR